METEKPLRYVALRSRAAEKRVAPAPHLLRMPGKHERRIPPAAMKSGERPAPDGREALRIHSGPGETRDGDIPAVAQTAPPSERLRNDMPRSGSRHSFRSSTGDEIRRLREESMSGPEARRPKASDEAGNILRHNQGAHPPDFGYRFSPGSGAALPEKLRRLPGAKALRRIEAQHAPIRRPHRSRTGTGRRRTKRLRLRASVRSRRPDPRLRTRRCRPPARRLPPRTPRRRYATKCRRPPR